MCSLACCCGRAESILAPQADSRKKSAPRQHHPLAPSSAPDAIAPTGPSSPTTPHHPPAAPACQRAAPRAVATAARPMRQCRFTRSIRPPVPRSGVAPRRARKSYPASPHPVKGWAQGNRGSACPSQATRTRTASGLPGDALHRIDQLREPHQFTTTPLLCQVRCPGSLFAPRLALRRWVRESKMPIVRGWRNYVKSWETGTAATP